MKIIKVLTEKPSSRKCYMRAIYKNKLYDTEKSENICRFRNHSVYKTKNGTLFMTCRCDAEEKVSCISQTEIRDFIGEHFPDIYIELFGEVEEA